MSRVVTPRTRDFLLMALPALLADQVTKALAFALLQPAYVPHRVLGQLLRLTLVFNRDAAFNLSLGDWSRWGFASIAVLGIVVILLLLRQSPAMGGLRPMALGFIAGGAAGNLADRLRWDRGVVDFVDVGVGQHRFWTFNVADLCVTIGALLLIVATSRALRSLASGAA